MNLSQQLTFKIKLKIAILLCTRCQGNNMFINVVQKQTWLTLTLTAARVFRDATQYKYETSLGIILTALSS